MAKKTREKKPLQAYAIVVGLGNELREFKIEADALYVSSKGIVELSIDNEVIFVVPKPVMVMRINQEEKKES